MKRTALLLPLILLLAPLARAASLDSAQRAASGRYVRELQAPDGGFRPAAGMDAATLGTTTSSLRALKYFGGSPRDAQQAVHFVRSCFSPAMGGFADTPAGAVDVRSTAMGLMAMVELKLPLREDTQAAAAAAYLDKNARSLPEVYIAAAALDAAGLENRAASRWAGAWEATRTPEGTYGKGAFDTAGAAITILRLGRKLGDRAAVLASLRAAQRPDGGFAATGETSDLSTAYRMTRAFRMLNEKPDLERLRGFVARCRNADGGYGNAPGQPSAASPTYFAAIVLHWADELARKS